MILRKVPLKGQSSRSRVPYEEGKQSPPGQGQCAWPGRIATSHRKWTVPSHTSLGSPCRKRPPGTVPLYLYLRIQNSPQAGPTNFESPHPSPDPSGKLLSQIVSVQKWISDFSMRRPRQKDISFSGKPQQSKGSRNLNSGKRGAERQSQLGN